MLSLVAPYTAEEMWERLGHQPSVARAGWPEVDEALLVEESVTAVVQVHGKVRARLEVAPDITDADLEAAAMADQAVVTRDRRRHRAASDRPRAEAGQHRRRLAFRACPARPSSSRTRRRRSRPRWPESAASSSYRCRW